MTFAKIDVEELQDESPEVEAIKNLPTVQFWRDGQLLATIKPTKIEDVEEQIAALATQ